MSKLFIANTTKHIQQFGYRIPEFARLFEQKIMPGDQVLIYQDSPKELLEGILLQHTDSPKPFCISSDEAMKHKGFVGLIYSFDKPVPADKIEEKFAQNDTALTEQGLEQRKESAAALSQQIDENAEMMGAGVNSLEVSVTEQSRKDDNDISGKMNETIEVTGKGKKNRG